MEPILKAEKIRVTYNEGQDNEFTALNDISLEVYPEEYIIFFGPSGCGKSTMLYTLLGVQSQSAGKIFVNGRDSATFSESEKSVTTSQFFGIVFQNFNLIYSLSVEDNIVLPQIFIDVSKKIRKQKGDALMERFGIATRAHNLPNNLSGGQQQRVAICRALINDPQILLADEPVGNLDSESARIVMQSLSEINRKDKKTIILVTHDPNYLPFANRVFYFRDGKLERVAVNENPKMPDEVLKKAEIQQQPEMTEEEHKDLERLAHVRPALSVTELKSWVLTEYLLEELSIDQQERLEKNMEGLLGGLITMEEFRRLLETPYAKGGVGLYSLTAKKYAEKIEKIIAFVSEFKSMEFNSNHKKKQQVIHLTRRFLLDEYRSSLTYSQNVRLERLIVSRLNKEVTEKEFVWLLSQPIEKGGVHLHANTAIRLGERFEIILAAMQK